LPDSHRGLTVRIEVLLPDGAAIHNTQWLRRWFTPAAASVLSNQSVALGGDADSWHVIDRAIPQEEWQSVIDMTSGARLTG
jgi:hypothetical protein